MFEKFLKIYFWKLSNSGLDSFHGGEGNGGEEFGRGGGDKVEAGHVLVWCFFTHHVSVHVLEKFVETEFAGTFKFGTNTKKKNKTSFRKFSKCFKNSEKDKLKILGNF